jgi:hypothetical protein
VTEERGRGGTSAVAVAQAAGRSGWLPSTTIRSARRAGSTAGATAVWMNWTGGAAVAGARDRGFRRLREATAQAPRATRAGNRLHALDTYWQRLPASFAVVVIHLETEQRRNPVFLPAARSRGETGSWSTGPRGSLAGSGGAMAALSSRRVHRPAPYLPEHRWTRNPRVLLRQREPQAVAAGFDSIGSSGRSGDGST